MILTLFMALIVQISFAQQKTISGTVSDENGLPLIGTTVLIVGTSSGTTSDFDGKYAIKAKTGDVLSYSYVGYSTQNKTVGAANTINATLQPDNTLDEVVVTAFGIKRNSKQLGYAVSRVKTSEITENSEPDLIRSLAGKIPGVTINTSTGVAGASNRINIRGATTIGSSTQPLIVVDGVAYDNTQVTTSSQTTGGGSYESGISGLDPNNIESVNVLKSTAASALYGSRAANGVIVITTKSGSSKGGAKGSKLNVSVSSSTVLEEIANLPDYQNTYGNGVNFSYVNANGSWGPRFDSLETIPAWPNLVGAFPDQFPVGSTVPYEAQPNNVEDLFNRGITSDQSISLSYSGEDGNFSATLSDLEQEGYIPFNTYDRTAFAVGGNFRLPNKLTVGGSMSFSSTDQVGGFFGNNQFAGSGSSFARALWLGRTWDFSLPYTNPTTGASVTPNNGYDHPLWSWEHDQIKTNTERTVVNFNLHYPLNENISTSFRVGYNKYNLNRDQIRDLNSRGNDGFGSTAGVGSIVREVFTNEDIESTFLANFDYQLNDDITFSAIVGNNILQNSTFNAVYNGNTFISPNVFALTNTVNRSVQDEDTTRERTVGLFGDITLGYKDYIFLNATGRNDWNSTLPKDNRSYFYPSASVSLIFTEAFNLKSDILTFGKIRGGFASVGRAADPESLIRTFSSTIDPTFNGSPTVSNPTFITNSSLTPEFTNEIEFGTDLEFLNRRIVVDFTWYKKTTTDLISRVSVPESSGFTNLITNIGEMENTGVEIGLTLVPFKTENFKWESFTTFTKNDNTVTKLVDGLERIQFDPNQIAHAQVGQPFGVFYGTRFARDDNGNFLINQATGGVLEASENGVIGDPNPDFKMGFINTFSYKGFSLNTQFDWTQGGDFQSISINSLLGRGVTRDTENRERTFIIPGYYGNSDGAPILDSNGDQIPNTVQIDTNELYFSPANSNTFGINTVDEGSVYDATVYRLRELSLSYSLPKKLLDKTPFGSLTLSLLGNNLWYFAPNVPKHTNYDPEVTAFGSSRIQGIEISSAPTSKRYGFKLNLTF